jgi:hypothetical protein
LSTNIDPTDIGFEALGRSDKRWRAIEALEAAGCKVTVFSSFTLQTAYDLTTEFFARIDTPNGRVILEAYETLMEYPANADPVEADDFYLTASAGKCTISEDSFLRMVGAR